MWSRIVVPNVDSDATVRVEIDYIPFWVERIGVILFVCEKKNRMIVITLEGAAIHDVEFVPCLVDNCIDRQVVCDAWIGNSLWVIRNGLFQWVLFLV